MLLQALDWETSSEDSPLDHSSKTSPEPQSFTVPQDKGKSLVPPELAVATAQFLADLTNYIPLGTFSANQNADHDVCKELGSEDTRKLQLPQYLQTLTSRRWIRLFLQGYEAAERHAVVRVYALPDDVGRRYVERNDRNLRKLLIQLLGELDCTPNAWEGRKDPKVATETYTSVSANDDSLFYLFNTIPSPSLDSLDVSCQYSKHAIKSLLGPDPIPGLRTRLHSYQKRTAATMIKREADPALGLDPRLLQKIGPTWQKFYLDTQEGLLFRDKKAYEEVRGGLLSESMGLGKTLISLATILATKGHWPSVPPQYSENLYPVRPNTGSLMEMAAAAAGRERVPWRGVFQNLSIKGENYQNCINMLERSSPYYIIPPPVTRMSRRPSTVAVGKKILLSSATLVIVPQNLLSQWKSEIAMHFERDTFKVLCLEFAEETVMPPAEKLLSFDILLISRQRFEREIFPQKMVNPASRTKGGCGCSLDADCRCSISNDYQSPLESLHFLRIIMDEGHRFASAGRGRTTGYWALSKILVDRKWIVSGTPASGLIGVEVGAAAYETSAEIESTATCQPGGANEMILRARRKEAAFQQERKDLESFRIMVTGFLQLKPWANNKNDDPASWDKYVMPSPDGRRKPGSLKKLLESLVVRHRIEDVEREVELPPLHNRVVYLQPSWHDKLSINLFIIVLIVNAVASERRDEDYMFHSKNRFVLQHLITNLQQSGFYWTSFTPAGITATIRNSREYLDKQTNLKGGCSGTDRSLLERAILTAERILASSSWKALSGLDEMGLFVNELPSPCQNTWALVENNQNDVTLFGATQLSKAQKWVDSHLYLDDLSHGFASLGKSTMKKVWQDASKAESEKVPVDSLIDNPKKASPSKRKARSGSMGTPRLTEKQTMSKARTAIGPLRQAKAAKDVVSNNRHMQEGPKPALKPALKSSPIDKAINTLPSNSPFSSTALMGTASAKLSYLVDKVSTLRTNEKILIFYEGDQIAYYIAQAFDLIDVRYLIYTRTLDLALKSAYIATFNTTPTFRVMLMNIHEAAHGLHIASASRVFFVNPVFQPNVEAQAIKRAHRIGQSKPVYVETLVLQDTLEDHMLQRRKGMTALEHQKAEKSLLDDKPMSTIIENARLLPLLDEEMHDVNRQIAKLQVPQKLFGRPGSGEGDGDDPYADLIFPIETPKIQKQRKKRGVYNNIEHEDEDMYLPIKKRIVEAQVPSPPATPVQGTTAGPFKRVGFSLTDPETRQTATSTLSAQGPSTRRVAFNLPESAAGPSTADPSAAASTPLSLRPTSTDPSHPPRKKVGFTDAADTVDKADEGHASLFGRSH